jgi:hypothetical protein
MSVLHPLTKVLLLHSVQEFLVKLKNAGLGSLPGTAAEVWGIEFCYVSGCITASGVCVSFLLLSSPDSVTKLITRILQVAISCYEQGTCLVPNLWKMWGWWSVWTLVDVLQVLDDEVRSMLCPDKITTNEWLEVCLLAAHIFGRGTCA